MIKSWLITIAVLLAFVAAYPLNLFSLLASRGIRITALILVLMAFLLAFKVLGNPFRKADDDDDTRH